MPGECFFCNTLKIRGFLRIFAFLIFSIAISLSISKIAEAEVAIGSQIDIYVGPDGQQEQAAAYDPINRRFLVVWDDYSLPDPNIYGQMINEDGSLYAGRIAICEAAYGQGGPHAAFDPVNQRFLVAWGDARIVGEQMYETYGQFVNNDGSLWGDNFVISPVPPDEYKREGPVGVVFEPNFNRFLVLMLDSPAAPHNLYGRFVNTNGALGDFFSVTNFISGYGVWGQKIGYDSNNSRFLIAYGNPYGGSGSDGSIYGRLLNADGTFFSEEFIISDTGEPGGSNSVSSISFDPFNNRFLAVFGRAWWMHIIEGQLINADGSLYAGVISIKNYADDGRAVFDTANVKFLVVGADSQNNEIFGQLLYPDGELFGLAFTVDPVIGWLQLCQGSSETGYLLTTSPNFAETGRDILGRIIKIVNRAPVLNPIGNNVVYIRNLLSFQVSGYDPDADRVSLTATGLPEGASFVDNGDGTGTFSWTPSGSQIGPYQVTFQISDGNLSDEEVITITVKSGGGPPRRIRQYMAPVK